MNLLERECDLVKPILIYHWHRLIKYLKTLMLIGNVSEQRDLNLMTFVAVPSDFVFPLKLLSQEFLFHFLSLTFLILRILHSCHRNVSFLSQTSYKLQGTLFPKPGECLSCHFSCLTFAGTYFWLLPSKISSHDAPFIHLH